MQIFSHGKNEQGFSTLDSLIAILVLGLALGGVYPLIASLTQSMEKSEKAIMVSMKIQTARYGQSWVYGRENKKQ